jgi:hypothetical protein
MQTSQLYLLIAKPCIFIHGYKIIIRECFKISSLRQSFYKFIIISCLKTFRASMLANNKVIATEFDWRFRLRILCKTFFPHYLLGTKERISVWHYLDYGLKGKRKNQKKKANIYSIANGSMNS